MYKVILSLRLFFLLKKNCSRNGSHQIKRSISQPHNRKCQQIAAAVLYLHSLLTSAYIKTSKMRAFFDEILPEANSINVKAKSIKELLDIVVYF